MYSLLLYFTHDLRSPREIPHAICHGTQCGQAEQRRTKPARESEVQVLQRPLLGAGMPEEARETLQNKAEPSLYFLSNENGVQARVKSPYNSKAQR